jgi:hypothetical protein
MAIAVVLAMAMAMKVETEALALLERMQALLRAGRLWAVRPLAILVLILVQPWPLQSDTLQDDPPCLVTSIIIAVAVVIVMAVSAEAPLRLLVLRCRQARMPASASRGNVPAMMHCNFYKYIYMYQFPYVCMLFIYS